MEENFKEEFRSYWKQSNFWKSLLKNLVLIIVLIWDIIKLSFIYMGKLIRKYPLQFTIICCVLLVLLNIYTFVNWKVTERNVDRTSYLIQNKIDSAKIAAYSEGYEDGSKVKNKIEIKEKPEEIKIVHKRKLEKPIEKKDSIKEGEGK